jgi:hypothetical protein
MGIRTHPDRLQNHDESKPSRWLSWPAIVISLLLVWPLGVVLLVIKIARAYNWSWNWGGGQKKEKKIPYSKLKSKTEQTEFLAAQKHRSKVVVTAMVLSALFIILGCYEITKDYVYYFFGHYPIQDLLSEFLSSAVFMLVGIYISSYCYSLCLRQHRVSSILSAFAGKGSMPVADIAKKAGLSKDLVRSELPAMVKDLYFGRSAYLDAAADTFYCSSRSA